MDFQPLNKKKLREPKKNYVSGLNFTETPCILCDDTQVYIKTKLRSFIMGKQYNKIEKRARRARYMDRLKERANEAKSAKKK